MRDFERELIQQYADERKNKRLDARSVNSYREAYKNELEGHIRQARSNKLVDAFEEALDTFKIKMLDNKWPIEDMILIERLWISVQGVNDDELRAEGQALLESLNDYSLDRYAKHQLKMVQIEQFVSKLEPNVQNELKEYLMKAYSRRPALGEYPGDPQLKNELGKEVFDPYYVSKISKSSDQEKARHERLRLLGMEHNLYTNEARKNAIRRRGVYTLPKLTQDELNTHALNTSQKKFKVAMSQRDAMKQIFGEEKYNEIDAMYMAEDDTRTIPIHNARGNAQLDAGERVLEFDFAGSGYAQARKEHHGLSGKDTSNGGKSDANRKAMDGQYGSKVTEIGNMKLDEDNFVRRKETKRGGKTKYRYTIPGPSCTWKGWTDFGKYRISNNVEIALKAAQEFLKPLMQEYKLHKNDAGYQMKPVRINLYGHSRGGVAASETLFEVYEWLKSQKGYEGFLENVHFDLVQRDPVPGPDVASARRRRPDLREIKNLNSTTIVTTLADKDVAGLLFRPQRVRGQERLIIGTTPHGVGLEGVDHSQLNEVGDGVAHQYGYYDAETKEFYRGSGINDLPKGVYLTDEKHNLIRVTRYSQVDKMINLVIPKDTFLGGQEARQMSIREEVKNWFLDNGDLLTYKSEAERNADIAEVNRNRDYILNSKNSAFDEIRAAIHKQMEAEADDTLDAEGKRLARVNVIKAIRSVMNDKRIESVDKSKERDITARTDNKEWNALCDLYILTKTDDNYQNGKQRAFADYKQATENMADIMRYFGDMKCAANQLAIELEGKDPATCQDAIDLQNLAMTVGTSGMKDTPEMMDMKNKQLLSFIEMHRGEGRQKWSSDKKLDEKVQEFAERFMNSLGLYNHKEESITRDETLRDKTFEEILDLKYEAMNAEESEEKRQLSKSAERCKNNLAEEITKAKRFYDKLMRLNVNAERDSKQFTAMREALWKVTELGAHSSPVKIQQAFENLGAASKTYTYKIEEKGGGKISYIGKKGAQRYDLANELTNFAEENIMKEMSTSLMATKSISRQLGKQREHVNLNDLENEEKPNEIRRANTVKKTEKTNQIKRSNSFAID